jgi:hypothetical protein
MNLYSSARILLIALSLVGGTLLQPQDTQQPNPSRDNFHGHPRKLKSISPQELDRAVDEDFAKEQEADESTSSRAATTHATKPVHRHRVTRDAMSQASFASATRARGDAREFQITLKNPTIDKYKNRATITTSYQVVKNRVHPVKEDGDMHIAGLADEVVLPCVAEIMNIKDFKGAADLVRDLTGSQEPTTLTGAFRLWCEHPDAHGGGPMIQGDVIPDYTDSNPAHVFEIHPLSKIGNINLLGSLVPIPDEYPAKDAEKAFTIYENLPCRIVPDPEDQTTTLYTRKVGYNYVKFKLRLEEDQHLVTFDTRIVRCSVLTLNDKEIATDRRMVFVQNSGPEKAVRNLKKGDTLTVMGMPRIDLAIVSWRARNAGTRPEALNWNLPYEMIIVGVYEDQEAKVPSEKPRNFGRALAGRTGLGFIGPFSLN